VLRYDLVHCKAAFAAKSGRACAELIENIEMILINAHSFGVQMRLVDLFVGLGSR